MYSLVLRTATRYMLPLMLLFSIFLLLRGHNEPGGGFIAALVAAAAFALYALAHDVPAARKLLYFDPHLLIGAGLLIALLTGLWPWLSGAPFLTGLWAKFSLPGAGEIELGSPVFFDTGVYLVVIGVATMIIFSLAEE
jgi:multicomponent Na+:H+ antiporter subunit B